MKAEDRAAVIDELGKLRDKIHDFKPTVEREKQLTEEVQSWYREKPGDKEFIEEGREYSLVIGARATERTITAMAKLAAYLGMRKFFSLCSFGLKYFDEHVPLDDRAKFVKTEQTGGRKLKVIAKTKPKAT